METPPASAMSHSPFSSACVATCTATSEVLHALWMFMLGPRSRMRYDTWVVRKSFSVTVLSCQRLTPSKSEGSRT